MSAPTAPLLSIIIPAFNRPRQAVEALLSDGAAPGGACEIIVVDDGSTDDTARAVETAIAAHGLGDVARVLRQANAGPSAARNTGARAARGRWLAFLDSDDLWFPWTLAVIMQTVAGIDEPAIIFLKTTGADAANPDGAVMKNRYAGYLDAVTAMRDAPDSVLTGAGNLVISRSFYAEIRGFDPALRHSEDVDMFLRASARASCHVLHQPAMVHYRDHNGERLRSNPANMLAAMRIMFARYRSGAYDIPAGAARMANCFFAGMVVNGARISFAGGSPVSAYRLTLGEIGLLMRGGHARWIPRLLMTPVLHLVRSESYPFRFTPMARM